MNFSKKIGSKIVMAVMFLCLLAYLTPIAYASDGSLWDAIKGYGADLLDTAQEKGSELVDTVKEKGPGVVESAKDKGSELVDKAKNGLEKAGNAAVEFGQGSQQEFWERFDQQTGLDTSSAYRDSSADSPVPDDGSGAKDPHSDPDQPLSPPQDTSSQQPNTNANNQQSQPAGDTIVNYTENNTYNYYSDASTATTDTADNTTANGELSQILNSMSVGKIAIVVIGFIVTLAVIGKIVIELIKIYV